jgi:hypothetical protein
VRPDHALEPREHAGVLPGRGGHEALQRAGAGAGNRLGEVLGVAAVGVLNEEAPQVLLAMHLGFVAPEQRRELRMEGGKGRRHPVKGSFPIHQASLPRPARPGPWPSLTKLVSL